MDKPGDLTMLTRQFGADMRRGVDELTRLGYNASVFRRMLADHGPVEAARRLCLDPQPTYGLWRLQELNRLDASVEMWVLLPWYEPLFDTTVREQTERKLRLLDIHVDSALQRLVKQLTPPP
ncbi:hypothetical protein [Actinokineospora sp. NPDC004072]